MRTRGFTLVLTVGLLAMLAIFLVAIASVARSSLAAQRTTDAHQAARQTALYALDAAIAHAQQLAGPDQRATAAAEITAPELPNPKWTGVWDTRTNTPLGWLVSGGKSPTAFSPSDSVQNIQSATALSENITIGGRAARLLIGPATTSGVQNYVVAPLLDLTLPEGKIAGRTPTSTTPTTTARYAYWVGDEGVKLRANTTRHTEEITWSDGAMDDFSAAHNRARLEQLRVPRWSAELVDFRAGTPLNVDANAAAINRTQMLGELAFASPAAIDNTALRKRFHDVTTSSRSVLADSVSGGLRADLSQAEITGAFHGLGIENWRDTRPLTSGTTQTRARYAIASGNLSTSAGEISGGVFPVLTELLFRVDLRVPAGDTSGAVRADIHVEALLWNPYASTLAAEELAIDFLNAAGENTLPEIALTSSLTVTNALSLRETVPTASLALSPSEDWAPGELKRIAAASVLNVEARSADGATIIFSSDGAQSCGAILPTQTAGTPIVVRVRTASGATLVRTALPAVSEVAIDGNSALQFAIHARRRDPRADAGFRWASVPDPRASSVASSGEIAAEYKIGSAIPNRVGEQSGSIFANASERVVRFDLPRQSPLSIGDFRHALFAGTQTGAIGDAGNLLNGWFDAAFFSGAPRTAEPTTTVGFRLPNTAYRLLAGATGQAPSFSELRANEHAVAARVLVEGAFNVNSISEQAWRGVLGGARIASWRYFDGNGDATVAPSGGLFFRCPQNAQDLGTSINSTTLMQPSSEAAFRQTVRGLSDAQVGALARYIAENLRSRSGGRAFGSIREFVDSGLIAEAIAADSTINEDSAGDAYIDGAAAQLTQSDILAAIAPMITARSDTFVVRAYGETLNPATGAIEGRAWCEATLQRFPEFVDASQNPETPPGSLNAMNATYGRRFQVVSFRWLTPDEI